MRIAQFSDSFLPVMDGVGNVVFQYAQNLGRAGHECYVIAPQADTGYRGAFPFEVIDYIGMPLPLLKAYKIGMPALDMHCQNRLNMIQADIVHVHTPFIAGQAGLAFAQKHGCPVVGSFHSKYYDDFKQVTGIELLADAGVRMVVNFYEKCDEVWAVSESSAQTLKDYGYPGDVRVMPNGTDIRDVDAADLAAAKARFGLGAAPVLLYVGQINWKKNLRCVLEACARVHGDFRLVLAGQGPHEKEVRRLAEELGLNDRAVFAGHIADAKLLNALYRSAALFVFPSQYDNSPLVVREAAAMGTPAVVLRGSSAAECVRDGENGFLCDDDPDDLARVIDGALADAARLERIGHAARETIPVPWSTLVEDVVRQYERLLK